MFFLMMTNEHPFRLDLEIMADVPVSRQSSTEIQLEATIQSAHALLKAGMVEQATLLLAAFSPMEVNG